MATVAQFSIHQSTTKQTSVLYRPPQLAQKCLQYLPCLLKLPRRRCYKPLPLTITTFNNKTIGYNHQSDINQETVYQLRTDVLSVDPNPSTYGSITNQQTPSRRVKINPFIHRQRMKSLSRILCSLQRYCIAAKASLKEICNKTRNGRREEINKICAHASATGFRWRNSNQSHKSMQISDLSASGILCRTGSILFLLQGRHFDITVRRSKCDFHRCRNVACPK
jgi:hypothetical protein